jgi:hypothetical protein
MVMERVIFAKRGLSDISRRSHVLQKSGVQVGRQLLQVCEENGEMIPLRTNAG